MNVQLTQGLDVAELVLWAFFLFFAGLIFYLRREDRREGYPLEDDITGRIGSKGIGFSTPSPKLFRMPFGIPNAYAPRDNDRDSMQMNARRTSASPGSPIVPIGNPLTAGVGPGAIALRAERPDLNMEGHPRIVPMATQPDFYVAKQDANPIGFTVVGCDRVAAGTVKDIWVDTADRLIRYIEVATPTGSVLAPMTMATVERKRRTIEIDAVLGGQIGDAPATPAGGTITLRQEEYVLAYFGAGYLYATAARQEPLL